MNLNMSAGFAPGRWRTVRLGVGTSDWDWGDIYEDWVDIYEDWVDIYEDWVDMYENWVDIYEDWCDIIRTGVLFMRPVIFIRTGVIFIHFCVGMSASPPVVSPSLSFPSIEVRSLSACLSGRLAA
jgi:hypothetical protein